MVADELYTRLAELIDSGDVAEVFQVKYPDDYDMPELPVLVMQCISDAALVATVGGSLALREQRWQISIDALDLGGARSAKEKLIPHLHGYKSASIKACSFEGAPGEIWDGESVPQSYRIPIDFLITE